MKTKKPYKSVITACIWLLISVCAKGQCNFDIESNTTSICEKELVYFSIKNLPSNVKEVLWDIGGFKQVKNNNKPVVIFAASGSYDVELTITLNDNSSCTVKKSKFIEVKPIPLMGKVVASKSEVCGAGDQVQFSNTSSNATKWNWSIEGSSYNGTKATIAHKFENTGWPYVQLTVLNDDGCKNSFVFDSLVHVLRKPKIDLSSTKFLVCEVPGTLKVNPKFDYRGTDIKSYAWTFKGATIESDIKKEPSAKFYNNGGAYDIELNLESRKGCKFKYLFNDTVDVINIAKAEVRVEGLTKKGCPTQKFKAIVTGIDTSLINWEYPKKDISRIDSSQIDSTVFFFKNEGRFKITMVIKVGPCEKKYSYIIDAKRNPLLADFDAPKCLCTVPDSLNLINLSKGNAPLSYEWDIIGRRGFLLESTDEHVREVINSYQKYVSVLKVSDQNGCFDIEQKAITVKPNIIDVNEIRTESCLTGTFSLSEDSFCNIDTTSIKWYFFDKDNKQVATIFNGGVVTFPDTGYYSVAVRIKTKTGCYDSVYAKKRLYVKDCCVNFGVTFLPDSVCAGKIYLKHETDSGSIFSITSKLILSTDPKVRVSGKYRGNTIEFTVSKAGVYDFEATVFSNYGCEQRDYFVKNRLYVNKVSVEGEVLGNSGCFPNKKTALGIKSIKNEMYWGLSDTSLSYNWLVYPKENGHFNNNTLRKPVLTAYEAGQVDLKLKVANATGCSGQWQSINQVNESLKAEFFIPADACFSDTIIINNQSTGAIVKYEWLTNQSKDYFFPNAYIREPEFKPFEEGKRTLTLLVTDTNGCTASISKKITLVDVALDFTVNDTTPKCSPATYRFVATGKNLDQYEWSFGDGDELKTKSKKVTKIYDLRRVYPYKNTFSVKVSGKHSSGCAQTMVKKDLIKVRGPWPNFEIDNLTGCNPLEVNFTDNSENVARLYFDFGDRTSVDSAVNKPHIYEADTNKEFEAFRPYVVAHDEFGCRVGYYLKDTIKVYSNPKARFGAFPKKGCEPLTVKLNSRSKYAETYNWGIPQAAYKSKDFATSATLSAGVYDAQLVVSNKIGCQDTRYKPRLIEVYENPTASFTVDDSVACLNRSLDFYNTSFSNAGLAEFNWLSKVGSDSDSASTEHFSPVFQDFGVLDTRLIVVDNNNCSDTFTFIKAATVYDTLPVETPAFKFISHVSNSEVELFWKPANIAYLSVLNLYEEASGFNKLKAVFNNSTADYLIEDDSFGNQANCFQLELIDKCKYVHPSKTHCTVHLDINTQNEVVTELHWNHYVGWDSIAYYDIMRANTNGSFIKIAKVPGWQSTYIDSNFCDSIYQYKVVAVSHLPVFKSNSNSLQHKTKYTYQDVPLEVLVTTIENNNEVATYWQKSKQLGHLNYQISKREELSGKNEIWKNTSDTFITDSKADINQFHYTYKVRVEDQCANVSEESNIGRSILLDVNQTDNLVSLIWNQYRDWNNGVKEYIIEVRPPNASHFNELGVVADTTISDAYAYLNYEEPYAYRVKAVESGTNPDTSYSNERVVIPVPSVYAANAFSPNGDGVNDKFNIAGWALLEDVEDIEEFSLKIYNRWGERVFESHDISQGWDGTFNGTDCQLDQYIWHAKVTALNGKIFFLRGGVLLMR